MKALDYGMIPITGSVLNVTNPVRLVMNLMPTQMNVPVVLQILDVYKVLLVIHITQLVCLITPIVMEQLLLIQE